MAMWDHRYLSRIDFRLIPILFSLMVMSLLVISSTTVEAGDLVDERFFTPLVKSQLFWFVLGWGVFLVFAGLDYQKLRNFAWVLYGLILIALIGLFFTAPIQNVHRWYRLPGVGIAIQPSEYAKLIVVIALSSFLEIKSLMLSKKRFAFQSLLIVLLPFILILKQPDLGTALILFPISFVMFYFAGVHKKVIAWMTFIGSLGIFFVILMFLGVISHEGARPVITTFLKDYQYERLNPNTYHQKASQTAIALGGVSGSGWHKSQFTGGHWLPAAHTDSVFAAYAEEFGLIGIILMLLFFFGLIYFSFQVTALAKDRFGRLLSAGIAVYLSMHVIINMGMMCGFLPITGVPLILISYGGSSVVSTMMALGILQSIYSRRFTF
jgi:rod shape determining protein RodA